jgi:hypothetical protein
MVVYSCKKSGELRSIEVLKGSALVCSGNDIEHGPTNEAIARDAESDIECEFRVGSVETD